MSSFLYLLSVLALVAALIWANNVGPDDTWGAMGSYLVGLVAIAAAYIAGAMNERER